MTSRALRLRREHPDWFAGSYDPLAAEGPAPSTRSRSRAAATRSPWPPGCPAGLRRRGGWGDTALPLPERPLARRAHRRRHAGAEHRWPS